MRFSGLSLVVALLGFSTTCTNVFGQPSNYPTKPIRIIIPYAVGGGADTVTRLAIPAMQKALGGATIIVDNRPGGGSAIGAEAVARSAPDGYTLMVTLDQTMTMNPYLYEKLSYDPLKDFEPVSTMAMSCILYVINPSVPVKTFKELIDYAKANPNKINYGSGAVSGQVAGQRMLDVTGTEMTFVSYNGGAPTLAALLNNEVQFVIADVATFKVATLDGRLRGLAVSTDKRAAELPDVPTIGEAGFPNLQSDSFWAMYAPAGTPKPIIQALNNAVKQAMSDKEIAQKVASLGTTPMTSTPEELRDLVVHGMNLWGPVIKKASITAR